MASSSPSSPHLPHLSGLLLAFFLVIVLTTTAGAIHVGVVRKPAADFPVFNEAPAYRNGEECSPPGTDCIHIAMTLDVNYIRGTMAAILSILQHTSCPENVDFHFLYARYRHDLAASINSTFPYLNFSLYRFNSTRVRGKISKSIRIALDQPLNYARIYLADMVSPDVDRVIYLDSDIVVVDEIRHLWEVELDGRVVGAPEYCNANFTEYFTDAFWSEPDLAATFARRKACYFNTGVMVMDIEGWRRGDYTTKMEDWMVVQKQKRIYHLGSLPPFLLVMAGHIKAVDHRWNQHGLGGDNLEGRCRKLHPGPISLLHWSGKGKPWLRLDSRKPCQVDYLWAPYDLYRSLTPALEE